MSRLLRRQEELVERWTAAGGPGFEGRARALLVDARARGRRSRQADARPLGRPAQARRRSPRACSASPTCCCSTSRRRISTSRRANASSELMRAFDGAVVAVSHDRYLLDETVAEIAELERRAHPHVAGQLLRLHGRARARAAAAAAGLRDAAEGDRAARGGDPPVRGLGVAGWSTNGTSSRRATSSGRSTGWRRSTGPVLERRKIALELRPHARGGERVVELAGVWRRARQARRSWPAST